MLKNVKKESYREWLGSRPIRLWSTNEIKLKIGAKFETTAVFKLLVGEFGDLPTILSDSIQGDQVHGQEE